MIALPAIGGLALALWCLAAALAITLIVEWLINYMGGVPIIGGAIKAVLTPVAHAVSYAVGLLEHGIDALIGAAFNTLAWLTERLWQGLEETATLGWQIAKVVGGHVYAISGLQSLVHRLERAYTGIEHGVKNLTREYHGIDRRVSKIEHEIGKGIGNDVRASVRALETEVTGIEQGVIPGLRAGIKTAEGEVTQLEQFIKAIPGTRYLDWAEGITIAALGTAIVNGLRCSSLLSSLGSRGCGLWNGLESLLGLFIDGIILTDLCAVIPEVVKFFSLVETELTGLIAQAADAICSKPPKGWVVLDVAPSQLPPAQTFDPTTL